MKTLLKWFVKKCVSRETLKNGIHAMNAELAKRKFDERQAKVLDIANDVSEVTAAYCGAFADGVLGPDELDGVNKQCDSKIDKYVDDAMINKVIDAIVK